MLSFSSEFASWRELLKTHSRWALLSVFVFVISLTTFFLSFSQYRSLSSQFSFLNQQYEILLEIDGRIPEEERGKLQSELTKIAMVKSIDFWSPEKSRDFIDQGLLPGYSAFLQKTGSEIPVPPLFRVQLSDLKKQDDFLNLIAEKYGDRLSVLSAPGKRNDDFFSSSFLVTIESMQSRAWWLMVLSLFTLIGVVTLVISRLIDERTRTWSDFFHNPFRWFS